MSNFQALTEDKIKYDEKKGTIQIESRAGTVKEFHKGTELVRRLIESKRAVTIQYGANEASPIGKSRFGLWVKKTGSDALVSFNPESNPLIWTKTKEGIEEKRERPAYIALGHELIHALRIIKGDFLGGYAKKDSLNLPKEEMATVGLKREHAEITENQLRREHGVDQRSRYSEDW